MVFDHLGDLTEYLQKRVSVGDSRYVWKNFATSCTDENVLTHEKYPDDKGRVPRTGAY
jgi:hypothetical protein